ncbi:MAG TPA: peptidase M22 [Syntrophomonadaceae bacterium]|nr:peptidase M22 [Syntrophomonadaceae bacterium]
MSLFLGIDTSAYTTSLAIVDKAGQIFYDGRSVLEVPSGKRGLRQSEALFQHTKNLPVLMESLDQEYFPQLQAIGVSSTPRPAEDSYMPVFLAGEALARSLARTLDIPLYRLSHQEGHIMAGMTGHPQLMTSDILLAVHFSGGTSEVLHVQRGYQHFFDINCSQAGKDLHAGQLVDRVGVAMGLSFPAGPALEQLANRSGGENLPFLPASVSRRGFSFSGAETQALRMIEQGCRPEDVAFAVLRVIANTLEKCLLQEKEIGKGNEVLLVGGVMANGMIRKRLQSRLEHPAVGLKLHFAQPLLSTDNAVGTAMLAAQLEERRK